MFDILFRNAKVIDGTGNPWFYGDVGVEGGTINRHRQNFFRLILTDNILIKKFFNFGRGRQFFR